jgi:hypothetical protein
VIHGPLSPITEEDEDAARWSRCEPEAAEAVLTDVTNVEDDDDEEDDDFDVSSSVFTRTKTKKIVRKS